MEQTSIYFVALVYQKTDLGAVTSMLRTLSIRECRSDKEALGHAIIYFQDEAKEFSLAMHTVTKFEINLP